MSFSTNLRRRFQAALTSITGATEFFNTYDVTTKGTAEASKALVLNASKGIATITSATITTLTATTINAGAFSARAGGVLYANVADSTAYASTSAETFFDTIATIPAATLAVGSVVKVRFYGVATTTVANDTLAYKCYVATNTTTGSISGTALLTAAATDATNADTFVGEATMTVRTLGNSGTAVAFGTYKVSSAEGTMTVKDDVTSSFTLNTNAIQYVGVTGAWSHTSNANSCLLRQMVVEVY